MPDAGTLELVELDVALDFDLPCEIRSCADAARWAAINSCCPIIQLYCDVHKRRIDEVFKERHPKNIRHVACGRNGGTVRWESLR